MLLSKNNVVEHGFNIEGEAFRILVPCEINPQDLSRPGSPGYAELKGLCTHT